MSRWGPALRACAARPVPSFRSQQTLVGLILLSLTRPRPEKKGGLALRA
jgi:hypothetical protein